MVPVGSSKITAENKCNTELGVKHCWNGGDSIIRLTTGIKDIAELCVVESTDSHLKTKVLSGSMWYMISMPELKRYCRTYCSSISGV